MAKGVKRDDDLARLGIKTYDDDGHPTTDGFEIAYISNGKSEADEIFERELFHQDSAEATEWLHNHGFDPFGNLFDESKISAVENNGNSPTIEVDNDSSTAEAVKARLRAMM